jgi:peroxiredoxin
MVSLQEELDNQRTKQGGYLHHVNLQIKDANQNRIKNPIPEVGDLAIDFELPNDCGNKVSLDQLLKDGPVILNFFRGNFCDYCQLHLKALQRSLKEFKRYRATLVGISPSLLTVQSISQESLELTYSILSDAGNRVAALYGLKYSLSEELLSVFEEFGINLHDNYRDESVDETSMPIPATFVVNTDKKIVFAFHDMDYTKRAEPADIIASLISIY